MFRYPGMVAAALCVARVAAADDRTAPPFGGADGAGQAPAVARPAPPFGDGAHAMIAAGGAESTTGMALAGELELRLGAATATARLDHGETVLVGLDFAIARRRVSARWDDACVHALEARAATAPCWSAAAVHAPETVVERRLGAAIGVRRDGGRTDAVLALRLHPTRDRLADVIELGVTAPVAGKDLMYVNHARYAPGWLVRSEWRLGVVRLGGEAGMTGQAGRTGDGTPRASAYALVTLALAVEL